MTSYYFDKDLGHIYDVAERYNFVKDEIGYTFQFFAVVYDLSLTELEFIIDGVHFGRGEIFKNLDSTGFFKGKEVKDELFSLASKGYVTIDNKNETNDNYYYAYSHTDKARKLVADLNARLSGLLDYYGRGETLVDYAYMDVINKLNLLFDDLRIISDDGYLFKIESDDKLDSEYNRRFDLVRDIKKALNKKYPFLSIINLKEYKEMDEYSADEDDYSLNIEGRHILDIEYTISGKRLKNVVFVNVDNYDDIIELGEYDEEDDKKIEEADAFTNYLTYLAGLNTDYKRIKNSLRNLYTFLAPGYDLSLGEFEYCLYFTGINTVDIDEINYIDGFFIDDPKKTASSLIKKGFIYRDDEYYLPTTKAEALFANMTKLFVNTMDENNISYDKLFDLLMDYDLSKERFDELTDFYAYKFNFEDFKIEDKKNDELDEYGVGLPLDKAVKALIKKDVTNPQILAVKDEGTYISVIFTCDEYGDRELVGRFFKDKIDKL